MGHLAPRLDAPFRVISHDVLPELVRLAGQEENAR